jgi:hypothetical protein
MENGVQTSVWWEDRREKRELNWEPAFKLVGEGKLVKPERSKAKLRESSDFSRRCF